MNYVLCGYTDCVMELEPTEVVVAEHRNSQWFVGGDQGFYFLVCGIEITIVIVIS